MSKKNVETIKNASMRSEHTCNMSQEELNEVQEKINNMSPEELKEFRNQFDPDEMGFNGEESEINE